MWPFVNIVCLLSQLDQFFLTDPFIFFFENEQCKFYNLQPSRQSLNTYIELQLNLIVSEVEETDSFNTSKCQSIQVIRNKLRWKLLQMTQCSGKDHRNHSRFITSLCLLTVLVEISFNWDGISLAYNERGPKIEFCQGHCICQR